MSQSKVPSELRLSQSWDTAIERLAINGSVGFVLGGLASIVLFRKSSSRFAFASLGAGWGLGSAWTLNTIDFEKERSAHHASAGAAATSAAVVANGCPVNHGKK